MPLPDQNDPSRPLYLAARSMLVLGGISLVVGFLVVIGFGYLNPLRFRYYFMAGGLVMFIVPGVLFLVCTMQLSHRSRTAATFALLTAGGQLACAVFALAASATLQPVTPIPILFSALWIAALVHVIWLLWQSLKAISIDASYRRGFELSPVGSAVAVLPVDTGEERETTTHSTKV